MKENSRAVEQEIQEIQAQAALARQERVLRGVLGGVAATIAAIAIGFGWLLWSDYQAAAMKQEARALAVAAEERAAAVEQEKWDAVRREHGKCMADREERQAEWKKTLGPEEYLEALVSQQPPCA